MTLSTLNVVGTHHEFHNDEAVQIALLAWYNDRLFQAPAGGSLKVHFHRSKQEAAAELASGAVQLLVGEGGGDWDEHRDEGRLADACGATLAADLLGVRGNPELKLILDYALRADREGGQKHFELAEILKSLHGWSDLTQMRVLHIALAFLGAIRNRESGQPAGDRGVKLDVIVNNWLDRNYGLDRKDRCVKLILGEVKRWASAPDEILPFELPKLVEVMNSHGSRSAADVTAMVEAILDARVRRSYDFMVDCRQQAQAGKAKVIEIGGLRVGFAESDSRSMGAYLRSQEKCDLVVLQKSTGNVNIFSGSEAGKALMPKVAREILRAECFKRSEGGQELSERLVDFGTLIAEGKGRDLLGVPWYYHLEAGALHNGTSTHPDVESSKLTIRDLALAIVAATKSQDSSQPDRTGGG